MPSIHLSPESQLLKMSPSPLQTKRRQSSDSEGHGSPAEARSKDQLLNAEHPETQDPDHIVRVILMTSAVRVRVMTLGNIEFCP